MTVPAGVARLALVVCGCATLSDRSTPSLLPMPIISTIDDVEDYTFVELLQPLHTRAYNGIHSTLGTLSSVLAKHDAFR
jgi:hypothetical protein